jgi:hypothetical protein
MGCKADIGRDRLFDRGKTAAARAEGRSARQHMESATLANASAVPRAPGVGASRTTGGGLAAGRSSVGQFDCGRDTGLNRLAVDAYQ